MRTRIFGAIGAILAFLTLSIVPASAEGIGSKGRAASAVATTSDSPAWRTGCWVGVKADTQATSIAGFSVNDALLGGGGGCDYIFPGTGILVGGLADISVPFGTLGSDAGVDYAWFAGGRAGVLLSERLLAYALAGWTWHGIPSGLGDLTTTGLTFGAGAELLLTKNISTGIEWRRVDIGTDMGPLVLTQDSFGAFVRYRF